MDEECDRDIMSGILLAPCDDMGKLFVENKYHFSDHINCYSLYNHNKQKINSSENVHQFLTPKEI